MQRKRILHITFTMDFGGAERVIHNLVEHTDRKRFDVSILCLNQPIGPFGVDLQKKGVEVTALNRRPGFDLKLIKEIRQVIKKDKIDILHCHQYTPYVYGLFSSLGVKAKVIFTEHGRFYPDQRKFKRVCLNPFFSRFTESITAISSATRDALVEVENFPKNKIRVIYNGIENGMPSDDEFSTFKKSLGISKDTPVLGTVARLDRIKNQPLMIRALRQVCRDYSDVVLFLVGDGPELENLKDLSEESGLSGRVIFTGFRNDTSLFYKLFDIFLLTSFSEGTAMTLLEAMAAAKPSIVTEVGGNPEILEDNKTGFLIPSDDEEALVEKILLLLGNKGLREEMGQAARKRFEEKFTVEKMTRAYEEIYDKIT